MKIIGRTAHDGFLLDATEQELFNLIGFYSSYQADADSKRLTVGNEINISGMYSQLYDLNNKKKQLSRIAGELRIVADVLELRDPVIEKLTEGPF